MYEYKAKLVRVIDGDTIDCIIDLGFDVRLKERIRLKGIDTPESDEFTIITELDKKGKYGRILGTIILPDRKISLNQMLLDEGHAEVYQ